MTDREKIITDMCFTWRHDYGILKEESEGSFADILSSGMTEKEKIALWNSMAQIFDNNIAPYMEFKRVAVSKNICGND